jgi:hypothetical protein
MANTPGVDYKPYDWYVRNAKGVQHDTWPIVLRAPRDLHHPDHQQRRQVARAVLTRLARSVLA